MTKTSTKKTELKAGNVKNIFIRHILWHFGKGGKQTDKWKQTLEFFDNKCAYCGTDEVVLQKDHAIPANRKCLGTNQHGNFVPACKKCNTEKGDKDYEDYCNEKCLVRVKNKIAKFMQKHGYEPLAPKNSKQAEKITEILIMAGDDLDNLANRYAQLIKLLRKRAV